MSKAGDPLEKLNAVMPWEVFREPLVKALKRSDGARGGGPPCDPVLMFKVLVLQALYGLSDDEAEFQIQDRVSFMRFLGLDLAERVPDAKTIWLFPKQPVQAGAMEDLFRRFDRSLWRGGISGDGRPDRGRHRRRRTKAAFLEDLPISIALKQKLFDWLHFYDDNEPPSGWISLEVARVFSPTL